MPSAPTITSASISFPSAKPATAPPFADDARVQCAPNSRQRRAQEPLHVGAMGGPIRRPEFRRRDRLERLAKA
jgi:hypothetical protein